MTKMTAKGSQCFAVLVVVVVVLQGGMTEGGFTPVKWSPTLSEQCGELRSPDLSVALTSVAEMIVNDKAPSSLSKSCREIKENSPVSPSGFYTINDGSSDERGVVVYCDMDDLSSCPSLEQTLTGFKKDVQQVLIGINEDVDSLEQTVSGVKEGVDSLNQSVSGFKKDVQQSLSGLNGDVDSLEQTASGVKEDVNSLNQSVSGFKKDVQQALSGLNEDMDKLEETVSGVKEDVESLEQTVGGFKEDVEQTLGGIKEDVDSWFTHINSSLVSICTEKPTSCLDMKERCPLCESGIYEIAPSLNNVTFVYCAFENYCNVEGPWMRVASWDISESGSSCPGGLQLFVNGTVSACGIPDGMGYGCQSLPHFSSLLPFSQVCGRMSGYQKGSPDSLWNGVYANGMIDDQYVDGVSITRGSPRQHVWTYAIGTQENSHAGGISSTWQCPCVLDSTYSPPSFVGSSYFCESGCPGIVDGTTFHAADPLWDGKGCGALEEECCAAPGQPWFHNVLDTPTTDYIEMRLCIDERTQNENVLISSFEIYVQ